MSPPTNAPSTLEEVIDGVRDLFDRVGDATPIQVGKAYLEQFGVGSAPRVLFVPEDEGSIEGSLWIGSVAAVAHGCTVYLRGAESGADGSRFKAARALGDRVLNCLKICASGRFKGGKTRDASPTDVDAYGADVLMTFTYRRDVPRDEALWNLLALATVNTPPTSPINPDQPDGSTGLSVTIGTIDTTNTRP